EIDGQQEREAVEKEILIQIAERAEPAERCGKKNNSRDIAEQQIAQPPPSRISPGKPNRGDERSERDPAKPALIEWRKPSGSKQAAGDASKPRPKPRQNPKHAAILKLQIPNPKFQGSF